MATTYTTSLRFALMTPGDPAVRNAWGTILDNFISVCESAITGNSRIDLTGLGATYSLTTADNAPDQARQQVYPLSGTILSDVVVTIPQVPKVGTVANATTGGFNIILTTGVPGTTITVPQHFTAMFGCDGTNIAIPGMLFEAIRVDGLSIFNALLTANDGINVAGDIGATGGMTAGGQGVFGGTPTNDSASTGQIGEYVSAGVTPGSAVALTTNTPATIISISLTAGDWDVDGSVGIVPDVATVTSQFLGAVSTTAATFPAQPGTGAYFQADYASTGIQRQYATGTARISIAVTTTVYLVAYAVFTGGNNGGFGFLRARRVR